MEQTNTLQLRLIEKKHETSNIFSFKIQPLDQEINYKAGQFIIVDMHVSQDEKGPTRCFTISSSPTEKHLMITTKIRDSPFKQKLNGLKIGDVIDAKLPEGEFVLPNDNLKPLVFLSGGIGVTPFRSILQYANDKQIPNQIIVFDSNKTKDDILFKDEFDKIQKENKNIRIIYTLTENSRNWDGETGRIDKQFLRKYLEDDVLKSSYFYICGPPGMIKELNSVLKDELQVSQNNIKIEEFTGY